MCGRLIVADGDGRDDHVATVVEGDRKHRFRRCAGTAERVAAATDRPRGRTDKNARIIWFQAAMERVACALVDVCPSRLAQSCGRNAEG
jgi:hypothetical protein